MRNLSFWLVMILAGVWVGACSPSFNPYNPSTFQVSPTPTGTLVPSGFTLSQFESASNLSAGQTIAYTLFYSEPSSAVVPNLAIWDTVPAGVQFLGLQPGPTTPPALNHTGNILLWTYPGPVTGLSGAITWFGTVSCASGPITNNVSLQTQNSYVTNSNPVVAFVSCYTDTPTPTLTAPVSVTSTVTTPVTVTATDTWTPSPTGTSGVTWTLTPTWTYAVTLTGSPTSTQPVTWTSTYTPTVVQSPVPSTPTPFVTCSAPVTWGDWNWTANPVTILGTSCQKYDLTKPTQVNSIDFLADTHGLTGTMAVGIYADGGGYPGNLIWYSGYQSFNVSGSLVSFAVPQVDLVTGTYWLAVVGDGTTTLEKAVGSTSTRYWRSGTTFPNPFMSPGGPLPTPVATPPPSSTTDIGDLWSLSCQ